jgi:hypothetical protein
MIGEIGTSSPEMKQLSVLSIRAQKGQRSGLS